MKHLIVCPSCSALSGRRVILGEITEGGHFVLERHRKSHVGIVARNFAVFCVECGQLVYIRQNVKTIRTANKSIHKRQQVVSLR